MDNFYRYTLHLLLAAASIFLLQSCPDDNVDPNPKTAPTFIVNKPLDNAIIESGENIPLNIIFYHSSPMTSYKVLLRSKLDNTLLFVLSESSMAETILVDSIINISVSVNTPIDIELEAEDAFGNFLSSTASSFTLSPPIGNTLALKFNLTYEGETLLMGREYTYPSGEVFKFSRFDMYMTNLALNTGMSSKEILDLDYLSITNTYRNEVDAAEGYVYRIAGLEDGEYDGFQFNIGLNETLNSTTPSLYPVSHPLGKTGEHWPTWSSYIFVSIEGRINADMTDPDLEKGIALHLGSNFAFLSKTFDQAISLANNEESVVEINIELKDIFINSNGDIYDIVGTPQTHSLKHLPMVKELSDNLKNAIQ